MVASFSKVCPLEGVCKGCILGKHHQEPFDSKKSWQVKNLLKLVHINVCYINIPSMEGAKCILNFIDDLSRYTWVYFLKSKNLVFKNFKEF
jgi:hypothetical protein